MRIIIEDIVVYDFSNVELQENSITNCYGTCDDSDHCDSSCDCVCDANWR